MSVHCWQPMSPSFFLLLWSLPYFLDILVSLLLIIQYYSFLCVSILWRHTAHFWFCICSPFTDERLRPFISFIPVMTHSLGCMILALDFCESFIFSVILTSPKPSVSSKILPWGASMLTNQHPDIMDASVNWLRQFIPGIPPCWTLFQYFTKSLFS